MLSPRFARGALFAALAVLLFPAVSFAQTSAIAGVVTDATGGVLPGVTVEAASPEERADRGVIKARIQQDLKRFFRKNLDRRPMIIPAVIES